MLLLSAGSTTKEHTMNRKPFSIEFVSRVHGRSAYSIVYAANHWAAVSAFNRKGPAVEIIAVHQLAK
jgi:hypothetical protein